MEILVFAQDEFGLPAIGHDLRMTVVSGSALVVEGGQMIDTALEVGGFMDPFENDGMYVGAVRATGTSRDTIALRITDLTSPNQPEIEVDIEVRQ
jgi:adhesin/invasin